MKTRKIELIIYGYGTRMIYELDSFDMGIDKFNKKFTLNGEIKNINWIGKKFLRKLK